MAQDYNKTLNLPQTEFNMSIAATAGTRHGQEMARKETLR